jgi:hypothetical protein
MHPACRGALLLSLLCPLSAHGQPALQPFAFDWPKAAESAIDLSGYLRAPAGKDGFIRVQGAHLVRPDGSRFRVWGVNLVADACFPTRADAALLAADLARLGVNCVRFHHMDNNWTRSLFDPRRDDTRHLDPDSLDRLDFLVDQLRRRGIYSNLNLLVSRRFKAGDGVRDYQLLSTNKSASFFNDRLIELQREYARQLLTHRNPYTGREYRHEPAVAVVEVVNENSVLEGWVEGRLTGTTDWPTQAPIPPSYAEELTDRYNRWLAIHVPPDQLTALRKEAGVGPRGRVPRLKPGEFTRASRARFHAEASFYMDVERTFFDGMKKFLKDELGVRSLLVGSSDHRHAAGGVSGYPHIQSLLLFDLLDGHGYWQHPTWEKLTRTANTPMVNDPLTSTVVRYARTPVVGRPFTVSETNHPFPHEYAAEGFPILTAYAQFQDWDGIYYFCYGKGRRADPGSGLTDDWLDFSTDPVKMTHLAACAVMWHRQDLRPAKQLVVRSYTRDQVIESLRRDREADTPFFLPGFARSTALQHATRCTFDGSPSSPFPPPASPGRIESDTGQLSWYDADRKQGLVRIDSERTEGLIGFVKGSGRTVPHLAANVENNFCALLLTALDGKPLGQSGRLLLAATSRATNTGLLWEKGRQKLADLGHGPVVIEPVTGTVTFRRLGAVRGVRVRPLGAEGRPLARDLPARPVGQGWEVRLGNPATTWCLIEVAR